MYALLNLLGACGAFLYFFIVKVFLHGGEYGAAVLVKVFVVVEVFVVVGLVRE
jgi:hypothetical protein